MNKRIEPGKKMGSTRIIIAISAVIVIAIAAAVLVVTTRSSSERLVSKGDIAFGKLPSLETSAPSASSRALGMPEGDGMAIEFLMPKMEYSWKGGKFPEFGDKMVVYRKPAKKIDAAEAKRVALTFGIRGEPQVEEPKILIEEGVDRIPSGGGVPANYNPQTEPNPGLRTDPARPELEDSRSTFNQPSFKTYSFYEEKEGKRLDIYEADRRFSYHVDGGFELAEKSNQKLPSNDEAKKIARDFLESKGLLPEDATGPFILDAPSVGYGIAVPDRPVSNIENHTGIATKELLRPTYIEVQFGRKFGDYDLVEPSGEPSRYIATVTIGPGGDIITASGELPTELEKSLYPLMNVSTAFNEIKKGVHGPIRTLVDYMIAQPEGSAQSSVGTAEPGAAIESTGGSEGGFQPGNRGTDEAPIPPDIKDAPVEQPVIKVELNTVKLAYMVVIDPSGVGFYEPAYVFSGVTVDPEGHKSDYSVAIPAVASEYIEKR
ncbi:MAG: hypothetical protein IBX64_06470 [Actinobacteria bacterium]|nr:hypothetical protein [Actinomycetota bacterium]